ncbi:uncharacterized protein JNUCC1_02425 [Lentibacillus sp. JNUCC-1]|uniref:DUF58 domain-containing protein n=1 Tax=Lentibacillus sp. JNUCC-1 TaxID=2654513 RepID=UPI0012E88596|nr:DUF58 domain-containing protein [Lentibacillus sp. JNUCC-1]MUV38571.1 uncharacterized protein [Lentibacillus sp. JNUCC-1]
MGSIAKFIGQLIFIVFLFAVLFSYAMFQGGFVSWFLFYAFLPIMLYHLGLLLYPVKGWRVKRVLTRKTLKTGGHIQVTIELKRGLPYPFYYLIVEDILPETLTRRDSPKLRYQSFNDANVIHYRDSVKQIVYPWFKKTISCTYNLNELPRGGHDLSAIRIRTGDVFGFIKKEHTFNVEDELIVQPASVNVRMIEQRKSLSQGDVAASGSSLKQTNVVTGVREYMPGDKFSWIDWKQTARKNDIMTKEFEQEQSTETLIILDGTRYDEQKAPVFEAAVELTLSLMLAMRQQALQVGFLSLGKKVRFFPVFHDPAKTDAIGEHLTHIQPSDANAFAVKLREQLERQKTGLVSIIVTTHIDLETVQLLKQMKQQGRRMILMYIQASNLISTEAGAMLHQLRTSGVIVNELTEKELSKNRIEVRT